MSTNGRTAGPWLAVQGKKTTQPKNLRGKAPQFFVQDRYDRTGFYDRKEFYENCSLGHVLLGISIRSGVAAATATTTATGGNSAGEKTSPPPSADKSSFTVNEDGDLVESQAPPPAFCSARAIWLNTHFVKIESSGCNKIFLFLKIRKHKCYNLQYEQVVNA